MSSDRPFRAILKDHGEAVAVIEEYLSSGDEEVIAPYVRGMMTYENEQAFAIMTASGNDMSEFSKLLSMAELRGLLSREETMEYGDQNVRRKRGPNS